MKIRPVLTFACIAASAVIIAGAQPEGPLQIGMIAYFGYEGIDRKAVEAILPFKVGDAIPVDKMGEVLTHTADAIQKAIGGRPTDIAPVCCDAQGAWTIYIGLAGKSNRPMTYNFAPTGNVRLPLAIREVVGKIEDEHLKGVTAGNLTEDDSHGYALVSYPPERELQEKLRTLSEKQEKLLIGVMLKSSSAEDRAAAAMALGYARRSSRQIKALVAASRDSDGGVRNDATRALLVMASSEPKTAARIPAGDFIAMLNSSTWTDRNKGTGLMMSLTQARNPTLLKRIRSEALQSLIEMSKWDTGHAASSLTILGRIAGLSDVIIAELITSGKGSEIVQAAEKVSL